MAVNLTEKRRNLARKMVALGPSFMDVLYALQALDNQRKKANTNGTPLVFDDADFTGISGLEHLDAAKTTAAFDVIATILTAVAANNFDDLFEALRP